MKKLWRIFIYGVQMPGRDCIVLSGDVGHGDLADVEVLRAFLFGASVWNSAYVFNSKAHGFGFSSSEMVRLTDFESSTGRPDFERRNPLFAPQEF